MVPQRYCDHPDVHNHGLGCHAKSVKHDPSPKNRGGTNNFGGGGDGGGEGDGNTCGVNQRYNQREGCVYIFSATDPCPNGMERANPPGLCAHMPD